MRESTMVVAVQDDLRPEKLVCGILTEISETGEPVVAVPGFEDPITVRTTIRFQSRKEADQVIGKEVLVCFTNEDLLSGVIVGLVSDSMWDESSSLTSERGGLMIGGKFEAKRIEFEGQDEVVLRCGKSKIQLRKDGAVIVKGKTITSRSQGAQKIRGATVNIN